MAKQNVLERWWVMVQHGQQKSSHYLTASVSQPQHESGVRVELVTYAQYRQIQVVLGDLLQRQPFSSNNRTPGLCHKRRLL